MPLFPVDQYFVDFIEVEVLNRRDAIQDRAAFLQEARAAKWCQDLHRSVTADVLVVINGVDDPPGVLALHALGGNGDFNCPGSRKIGGYLQRAIAVLRGGDVVIEAILVKISAEITVHARKQPVAGSFIVVPNQHTEADYVVDS